MKGMRMWVALLLAALAVFLLPLQAAAAPVPSVDNRELVHDFTGLMSQGEWESLSGLARNYSDAYSLDFVVVAVNDNLDKAPWRYADEFFLSNGFGQGADCDGILFYIDMTERDIYMSTSGRGINYFYDSDVDALLDLVYDDVLGGNDDASLPYLLGHAFLQRATQHIDAVNSDVISPLRYGEAPANYYRLPLRQKYGPGRIFLVSLAIGLAVAGLAVGVMVALHRRSLAPAPHAGAYLAGEGLRVTRSRDTFLHTRTTRTPIPRNNGSSGGGRGGFGGGTTHRTGGHSFGGGGRKF